MILWRLFNVYEGIGDPGVAAPPGSKKPTCSYELTIVVRKCKESPKGSTNNAVNRTSFAEQDYVSQLYEGTNTNLNTFCVCLVM